MVLVPNWYKLIQTGANKLKGMPNKANIVRLDDFYKHDCYVYFCFIKCLLLWHDNRSDKVTITKFTEKIHNDQTFKQAHNPHYL